MYRYGQKYHGGNYPSPYSQNYTQHSKQYYYDSQSTPNKNTTYYDNNNSKDHYDYSVDENQNYWPKYKRNSQSHAKTNRSKKSLNTSTKQNKIVQDEIVQDETFQNPQHIWAAKSSYKRNDNNFDEQVNIPEDYKENNAEYYDDKADSNVDTSPINVYRKGQFSQVDIEAELLKTDETIQEQDVKSLGQDHNDSEVDPHEPEQQRLYYGHYEYRSPVPNNIQFEEFQMSNDSAFRDHHLSDVDHPRFALRRISPKHANYLKKRYNRQSPPISSQQYDTRTVPYYYTAPEIVPYVSTSPIEIYHDEIETNEVENELPTDTKDQKNDESDKDNDKVLQDKPYKASDNKLPNNPNDVVTYDNVGYDDYVGEEVKGYFAVDGAWYPYPADNVYKYPSTIADKKSAIWTVPQIQKQLEYWFSDDNLFSDTHLQSLMDSEGWIEVSQIAKFSRMKAHGADVDKIVDAARHSSLVEVHSDGKKIRTKSHEKILSALQVSKDDINKIVDGIMERYQKHKDKPNTEENKNAVSQTKDKKDKNGDDKGKLTVPQNKTTVVPLPANLHLNANDVRVNIKIQQD
jgi:hypothetical protein